MKPVSKISILLFLVILLAGCDKKPAPDPRKGEKIVQKVCAKCHNLDMPPVTTPDEKAPPMLAVAFHLKDFMKVSDPSAKRSKFIEFVTDYSLHPDAQKSYCDKKSLQEYGLMPSLEGKVTPDRLRDAAAYIYDHYDKKRYLAIMQTQARLATLPLYKQVLERKNCLGCHGIQKAKIAPAFTDIAQKYAAQGSEALAQSIQKGSRGKWPGFKAVMPPFKELSPGELEAVAAWILERK